MSERGSFKEPSADGGERIHLYSGEMRATVLTAGGYVGTLGVEGRNILFPDQIVRVDGKKSRRGGIPILALHSSTAPPEYGQDSHGMVRKSHLEILDYTSSSALLGARFRGGNSSYPYNVEVKLKVEVEDNGLNWDFMVINKNPVREVEVPPEYRMYKDSIGIGPGAHTYLEADPQRWGEIETNIPGFEIGMLMRGESIDFPAQQIVALNMAGVGPVNLIAGEGFAGKPAILVLWYDDPKYFAAEFRHSSNGIANPVQSVHLDPQESAKFSMGIRVG